MKNTGRITAVILALLCAGAAYAAEITISAGSNVIAPGDSTELVITVKGGSADIGDTVVPSVDGLNISYGGSGSSFQFINGRTSSSTTLTFHVYGEKEGNYTIPPFTVISDGQKFYTQPVNITVKKGAGGTAAGARRNIYGDVELSAGSCYTGQPVIMRYFIYHDGSSDIHDNRIARQPLADGFIVKQINENLGFTDSVRKGQNLVKEHVATWCIIPEIAGSRQTGGGSMVITYNDERGFFSMPVRSELLFPEKKLRVIAIPGRGKPSGYTGDVGEFRLEAVLKSGEYRVNEEIKIPVTVSGKGNLFVMSKPAFEKTEGIRILVEENEPELALSGNEITGTKKFLVTIIPQAEGSFRPGTLSIRYFNPMTRTYSSASSDPLSIEIKGAIEPATVKKERQDDAGTGLPVFAYAGAGVLIAAALFGFVFIIIRERSRYAAVKFDTGRNKDEAAEIKTDQVKDLRMELETARGSDQGEKLMKLCLKALDMISSKALGKVPDELADTRRKLDAARYANAALSHDDMEDIYRKIISMLK